MLSDYFKLFAAVKLKKLNTLNVFLSLDFVLLMNFHHCYDLLELRSITSDFFSAVEMPLKVNLIEIFFRVES
jgi:hypothetical protein